jgi:hypothetical protein
LKSPTFNFFIKFLSGGFHMAQQCQAPIVPVVIYIPPSLYDGEMFWEMLSQKLSNLSSWKFENNFLKVIIS